MTFSAIFATAQTGIGYQLFDASGLIGSRVTSGISNPSTGVYVATADTSEAIGAHWTNGSGTVRADEIFAPALTEEQAEQLAEIIERLGTVSVTVASPVSEDGATIALIRGDDYLAADGRSLAFSSDGWPDLTGSTVVLLLGSALTFPADVMSATSVRVELSRLDTKLFPPRFEYAIQATLADDSLVTLVKGICEVTPPVR